MIHFCQSLYNDLPARTRWQIVLLHCVSSLLSLSWLVQLHFLITGFSADRQVNFTLAFSTALSFLISTGFIYYQSKRQVSHNNRALKILGARLWLRFLNWQHVDFKKQQRMYFFDVFMVNFWRVRSGYQALLMDALPALSTALFILVFILYLHPLITMLFLVFYGLLFFSQIGVRKNLTKTTQHFHTAWRQSTYQLGRLIDQFELHKMGRGKDTVIEDYDQSLDEYLQGGDEVSIASAKWSGIQTVMSQISRVTMIALIYFFYQKGLIEASSIVYLIIVAGWLQGQLARAQQVYPSLIEAVSAYNFLEKFMGNEDSKNSLAEQSSPKTTVNSIERIQLEGITFGYQHNDIEKNVLKGVDLELQRGKTYLLKGRNGSGKTTLAKLLVGFITPTSGEIRINDTVLTGDLSCELKSRMSYLHQDFSLFYGTAKENFSFGDKGGGLELNHYFDELMSDLIDPNYHVGDKGDRLSGGQKQRLALIREWGREADLYILDEPLNHLDEESTDWLRNSITTKKRNSIIIIISHLDGFEGVADEILTLVNGQLSYERA